MENKKIARTLRLLSQLMELHNENPFKIKSLAAAAFKIDKLPFQAAFKTLPELETIEGLGKSTAQKVWELLHTGSIPELAEYLDKTPAGVVEILQLKGVGPKKVQVIWQDLGIENVGELYYACNENRLKDAKGFGLKTQEEILKIIDFKMASSGRFLYAQAEESGEKLLSALQSLFPSGKISFTGDFRRKCEVIDHIDILIGSSQEIKAEDLAKIPEVTAVESVEDVNKIDLFSGIKAQIIRCEENDFAYQLVVTTGNAEHVAELKKRLNNCSSFDTETEVYAKAGLPFIEPELREGLFEFEKAEQNLLPKLVVWEDIKGTLHNHSTWSDGVHSLQEMAKYCRDNLNLEYLGISDHSKSAFYAKGLSEERIAEQHKEIDELNLTLAPFRIFKGIESDILNDGSLDYVDNVLATFDFVVASIHSNFKMSEEKATARLIKAIENPFTTILGHATGRMLLTRNGYPIDYKKVIDACAANKVAIEINSNPLRLDLDWRWHQYAINKSIMLSINPDAHRTEGFHDMRFGILAARKGGVEALNCLNTFGLKQIENFFELKKPSNL